MKAEIKGKFVFLCRGASYISRRQAGNIVKAEIQENLFSATRKSLIITALSIFRVDIFATLKIAKQLSLSNLQVTLRILRYLL